MIFELKIGCGFSFETACSLKVYAYTQEHMLVHFVFFESHPSGKSRHWNSGHTATTPSLQPYAVLVDVLDNSALPNLINRVGLQPSLACSYSNFIWKLERLREVIKSVKHLFFNYIDELQP